MKNYTFNWEIKDLITQFIGALDECVIKRYNEDKEVKAQLNVKYVYAPKTRTIHWLVNKQQHITLPVVSCWITSIERDESRVFNKIDGPIYIDSSNDKLLQPVPINISVGVSLLAKYQNDMDQMICNFASYTDPYIAISWKHPYIDREIRSEVLWNGDLKYDYPIDIQPNQSYRIGVDTSFTIKGWLFKKAGSPVGEILEVIVDFIGVDDWGDITIE